MSKEMMKKFRVGLLAVWLVLGVALLLLIQYANIHAEMQRFVTRLVWVYVFSVPVVAGTLASLKRRAKR